MANRAANDSLVLVYRDLRNLYSELVKGGLVTDAEFWKPRQDIVLRAAGGAAGKQQVIGLSSALLAQLQPTADGKKQVRHRLTFSQSMLWSTDLSCDISNSHVEAC